MNKFNDGQLVERYLRNKDETALEELVKRHLPAVFGLAKRYAGDPDVASDIAQETFVKVWRNLKQFDPHRASPRSERAKSLAPYRTEGFGSGFRSWILTIAKRTALDWLKKKNTLPFSLMEKEGGDWAGQLADDRPSILERLKEHETAQEMTLALARLPANYATVINLRINSDLSFREIAEILKTPPNTIKSRYRRGVTLLKTFLKNS